MKYFHFCPYCQIGLSNSENAAGICKNCKTDLSEEQIEDDEQDFECCSDCDNHDACEDFGCAVKQGIAIKYI